jgi:hypothetical protein
MSGAADRDPAREADWPQTFELLLGVVRKLVAAQLEMAEAVRQRRGDVELLAGLLPARVEPEPGPASERARALRAQAEHSLVQSSRQLARTRRLGGAVRAAATPGRSSWQVRGAPVAGAGRDGRRREGA